MEYTETTIKRILAVQAKKDRVRIEVSQLIGMLCSLIDNGLQISRSSLDSVRPVINLEFGSIPDLRGEPAPIRFVVYGSGRCGILKCSRFGTNELNLKQLSHENVLGLRSAMPAILNGLVQNFPTLKAEIQRFL